LKTNISTLCGNLPAHQGANFIRLDSDLLLHGKGAFFCFLFSIARKKFAFG
jgi:hypothetical protein